MRNFDAIQFWMNPKFSTLTVADITEKSPALNYDRCRQYTKTLTMLHNSVTNTTLSSTFFGPGLVVVILVICSISFTNLPKFSTTKNWLFHRILHVDISKKWPSDGRFELFLVDFLLFENKKVTLNGEIPGPTQLVQMPKFSRENKIQPKT